MENKYGVGITNRYSCFIDNEDLDPLEQLKLAEHEKETKKKGKTSSSTTAEKENRGKETTSTSSSVQPEKESPSTPSTVAQKKKVTPAVPAAAAPAGRKGIRDSNAKGNDVRGGNRGGHAGESGDRRGPRPERAQGDRFPPRDRFQGDRVQGDRVQGERGARFNNDEGREVRNNRRNQDDNNREQGGDFEGRGAPRREGYAPRGRSGGPGFRGPPRGGGGGGGGGPRKREFDRQSGSDKSGVKAIDKRDGAGSRNWGTYKDDEIESAAPADESMEEKTEGQEGTVDGTEDKAETSTGEPTEPLEDEPKQMTLEQWKALQQPRSKPVFNLRKAGEGEDQSKWNKMTLKKKEKEEGDDEEEDEEEEYDCPQRAGRQRQLLDVNFHFADTRRGFGGPGRGRGGFERGRGFERGGRGGGSDRPPQERAAGSSGERGGGLDRGADRGADRGERGFDRGGYNRNFRGGRGGFNREDRQPRQMAPKVDDERDFPSLG